MYVVLLVVTLCLLHNANVQELALHPDVGLNVVELITKYGYPFENHTVTTEDGYILELHRIPHGRNNTANHKKGAILLLPALLCSSADFVIMGPEKGLGYILADNGYDVWLGNTRGSTWSRKHVRLNPDKDREFWDFSLHELGYYDNAAFFRYILSVTGEEKIFYIGHSQGTTTFFILLSTRPEFNKNVRLMVGLAPAVYTRNLAGFLKLLVIFENLIRGARDTLGAYEILPHARFLPFISQLFCNDVSPFQNVCAEVLFGVAGYSTSQLNKTTIPLIVSNTPAGASIGQIMHFIQFTRTGQFRPLDYGKKENLAKYGKSVPEDYDLKKVTVPVAVFYAENDLLVPVPDVQRTIRNIRNVVFKKLLPNYNHLDVLWGNDAPVSIFTDMLKLFNQYN